MSKTLKNKVTNVSNSEKSDGKNLLKEQDVITNSKRERIKAAVQTLRSLFTKLPLEVGTGKEVREILRSHGHSHRDSSNAIYRFTSSKLYLLAIINGTVRYNPDGTPGSKITEQHRNEALLRLKKLRTKTGSKNSSK
ncbi:ProQ/FinO family protein [Vibrio parahaemolyticus]|jgi:sRNA-binding protein|uniref:ProQ/FINO family protein n=1 Tax=Vibrio TaxID=662 RepID=UPI0011101F1A|nr:ProQ/FINO family protein [Vibrio parahaemolyticus]MBE4384992.1 hypothetical protein [Vibrio parahaemolyticus]MCR9888069.1 ProQ/FinO family protein [Vibrio parahaemolyticus]MCR9917999.1 ProQ/FinO family protein [Vibrio parahaemolyticus]MEA5230241.1 ProQ/FINO family protein [Vibrio parahaemolyticus]NYU23909.1 hypothetical protein [Vibrio parahaemolyticus]